MNSLFNFKLKSNVLGAAASSLCLIHCLATPLLFTIHTGQLNHHHEHPYWWGLLDILFIIVSLIAVYWSAINTSKKWMQYALWVSWALLTAIILNEKLEIMHIAEEFIYLPSVSLVVLHLYNRKYCQCEDDSCCTSH